MKKFFHPVCGVVFLLAGFATAVSCNSSNKTNGQNASDTVPPAVSFDNQVADFDSTWGSTMAVLDNRIHQWDSSAETYRGTLKDKLQKKISAIKVQRDALKEKLGQTGGQAEDNWNDFRKAISNQYDSILVSMQQLSKDIQ